jgi:hypothetical protein
MPTTLYPPPYVGYPPVEIDNRGFWEKYQYVIIGVTALIMFVILALIIKSVIKAAERYKGRTKSPDFEFVSDPETGEIVVTNDPLQGYDPLPLAQRLVAAFQTSYLGWLWPSVNSARCEAAYEANNLSTNKLIAVAIKYKELKGVSLYSDVSTSSFDGCWFIDYNEVLSKRLKEERLT